MCNTSAMQNLQILFQSHVFQTGKKQLIFLSQCSDVADLQVGLGFFVHFGLCGVLFCFSLFNRQEKHRS